MPTNSLTDTITEVAGTQAQSNAGVNQFGMSQIPFHVHNGSDAPKIDYQNLVNTPPQPYNLVTVASSATPTINTDMYGFVSITALAATITSFTTNLTGSPFNFQKLIIRIKDNGSPQSITWGASFVAEGVSLPTTTTASKVTTVGFLYDSVKGKWGCVASVTEA